MLNKIYNSPFSIRIPKHLRKFPKILIYERPSPPNSHNPENCFIAFLTSNPKKCAIMYCDKTPVKIYHPDFGIVDSLYIGYLNSFKNKSLGLGTALINFAKYYSKKIGLKGFISLDSSTKLCPDQIPHIFYRKLGFSTGKKSIDKSLDRHIQINQTACEYDFRSQKMFFPDISDNKKKNIIYRKYIHIILFFKKLAQLFK